MSFGREPRTVKDSRRRILVLVSSFLPGEMGGGTVRSVVGLVEKLGTRFRFRILTADRDVGSKEAYPGIVPDRWLERPTHEVLYVRPGLAGLSRIWRILREHDYDLLLLNGAFARRFSLFPLLLQRLGLLGNKPIVIAPHGQLDPGALKFKRRKKRTLLWIAAALELFRGAIWQASTPREADEIRSSIGSPGPAIEIARDLMPGPPPGERTPRTSKRAGELRIVFVSRISPKKNLRAAIRMLHRVEGDVEFAIHGPQEDPEYWKACESEALHLPEGVRVVYHGPVTHGDVSKVFSKADLFFFPTLGENFGYVIAEALQAGCPVLVSNRTPWQDLEARGAGWIVPLEDEARFVEIIRNCIRMGGDDYDRLSASAYEFGRTLLNDFEEVEANRRMFEKALAEGVRMENAAACGSQDD